MSSGFHQTGFIQKTNLSYDLDAGTAPDLQLKYGSKIFAPDNVQVCLRRDDLNPGWTIELVKATGQQRLKDGGLSRAVVFDYGWRSYDQIPDWLQPILTEALVTTRSLTAEVQS